LKTVIKELKSQSDIVKKELDKQQGLLQEQKEPMNHQGAEWIESSNTLMKLQKQLKTLQTQRTMLVESNVASFLLLLYSFYNNSS
jgi:DNA-binding protein H-NS